jgi:hypothetical protein
LRVFPNGKGAGLKLFKENMNKNLTDFAVVVVVVVVVMAEDNLLKKIA